MVFKIIIKIYDLYLHDLLIIEFKKGVDGLSFYTSFSLNKEKMMQAFLLVSTINNHFLLSYTDKESYFRDRDVDGYFDEAWQSIASIEFTDDIYQHHSPITEADTKFNAYVIDTSTG